MKTKASIKKICMSCRFTRRKKKLFVICVRNSRHKQRQG
ncbi:UNVERIFIED_CONTAM: hypothetical protein GTU68_026406 [Idotea baltica]|nr:hypothetical protein [Idotea baltica]